MTQVHADDSDSTLPTGSVAAPGDAREVRRFESYTRWSFCLVFPVAHGLAVMSLLTDLLSTDASTGAMVAGAAAVVVHFVASIAFSVRAFFGGSTPKVAYLALTAAVAGLLIALSDPRWLYLSGAGSYMPATLVIAGGLAAFSLVATRRQVVTVGVNGLGLLLVGLRLRGVDTIGLPAIVPGAVGLFVLLGASGEMTLWMLRVVRTLAQSRVTHARLAVAEERLRFSRDLHDVYGRTLSTIAVKSELAAELARRGDERAVSEMTAVHGLAGTALADVRRIVSGYREIDPLTELAGARSVLRSAGARFEERGVEEALGVLDGPGRTAAAWVVREASTNVLRHARATTVQALGSLDADTVTLTITNDGADAITDDAAGTGLLGLAERLRNVGGRLVSGRDGDRFTLTVTLPVTAGAPDTPTRPAPEESP